MTMLPIDYLRRPWRPKYIDEETPEINQWFVFGKNTDGGVDVSDSNSDIFTNVPKDVAQEICEARNKFSKEIVFLLNRDTNFEDGFDYNTGLPTAKSCEYRPLVQDDFHHVRSGISEEWNSVQAIRTKLGMTYSQVSDALIHLRFAGIVEARVVDNPGVEYEGRGRPLLQYRKKI